MKLAYTRTNSLAAYNVEIKKTTFFLEIWYNIAPSINLETIQAILKVIWWPSCIQSPKTKARTKTVKPVYPYPHFAMLLVDYQFNNFDFDIVEKWNPWCGHDDEVVVRTLWQCCIWDTGFIFSSLCRTLLQIYQQRSNKPLSNLHFTFTETLTNLCNAEPNSFKRCLYSSYLSSVDKWDQRPNTSSCY